MHVRTRGISWVGLECKYIHTRVCLHCTCEGGWLVNPCLHIRILYIGTVCMWTQWKLQEMHVWSRRFLHYSSLTLPTGERLAGCRSWSTSSYRLHKPKTASSQKDTHKTSSSSQMNQFPSQINEFNVSHILIFIFYLECCEWTLFIYYQLCAFKDHTMVNHEWVKLHAIHASDRV